MAVFYRTYRPQVFEDVVGQDPIVTTLKNAVKNSSVAHAYLFTGSRGVGKTTIARLLAKAVNCKKQKNGEPCGVCEVCEAIRKNLFIDLVEIDAASNTGVDNVRELIEHIKFKPTSAKYKVFIIDEVHMLSKAAFNALLKTLEEPPEHAIFILATTDVHKVPATIISRTQRFDFSRITAKDIVAQLGKVAKEEKVKVDEAVLSIIARQAQGSMRDALSLLNKIAGSGSKISIQEAEITLGTTSLAHSHRLIELLSSADAGKIPSYFTELEQAGIDFNIFNRNFLEYLRALLVFKVTGDAPAEFLEDEKKLMQSQVSNIQAGQIILWMRLFLRAYKDLAIAPDPSLAMLLASMEAVMKTGTNVSNSSDSGSKTAMPATIKKAEIESKVESQTSEIKESSQELENTIQSEENPYTLEEVKEFWPQVLDRLKLINSPLATLVKNSPIIAVNGNQISLSVKYLFHKEHLESKKVHSLLQSTITDLGGKPSRLRIEIQQDKNDDSPTGADAISEVLRVFGGELVE